MKSDEGAFKELCAQFGLTAYKGQCLEHEAANVVFLLLKDSVHSSDQEFLLAIERGLEAQTLGKILSLIEKRVVLEQGAKVIIADALKKRNHLVHHFFRVHAQGVLCEDGRALMIKELIEARALFANADILLQSISRVLLKSQGMSDDLLERLMREELNKLGIDK